MMTTLVACEQGSPGWLQARAGACTASRFSDARARLKRKSGDKNVGDFTDACESYARLLAIERIAGEPLDETFQTWAMRRGHELEPVARALYMERTGYVVEESGVLLSDDRRVGYSTDGEVYGHSGGVEIKCPVAADKVAGVWLDPEPVIAEYLDQIDGGMWLAGWDWIDLVVYTPWLESVGKALFVRRIRRDEARIEALEVDLVKFLRLVNDFEARLRGVPSPSLAEPPPWVEEAQLAAAAACCAQTYPAPMLQDVSHDLSAALSNTPHARLHAAEAAATISAEAYQPATVDLLGNAYSAPERVVMLRRMRDASAVFYGLAVQTGCHPFIEFTGLMNEYINCCESANAAGVDFASCNTHIGQNLPMHGHEIDYVNEKLECIFTGRSVMRQDETGELPGGA